ncbi:MAG: hypothetical protein KF749_02905 [Bacteroidetes bacterium]|nr:hypothetical protein [Bacteroidota bacterium]MCW5896765.1 hypothetical protein [Bacteroidota bacterium]
MGKRYSFLLLLFVYFINVLAGCSASTAYSQASADAATKRLSSLSENLTANDGSTALSEAKKNNHSEIVELLEKPHSSTASRKGRAVMPYTATQNSKGLGSQTIEYQINFVGTTTGAGGQLMMQGKGTYLINPKLVLVSFPISEITSKRITLEAKDTVLSFDITPVTKLCRNTKKVTWSSFKKGDMVTVCSPKGKMTATSIRFGPALFKATLQGTKLQAYGC